MCYWVVSVISLQKRTIEFNPQTQILVREGFMFS